MKKIVLFLAGLLICSSAVKAQHITSHLMELGKYADGTPVKATFITMDEGFGEISTFPYVPYVLLRDKNKNGYVINKEDFHLVAKIKGDDDIFLLRNGYYKNSSKRTTFFDYKGKKLRSVPINAVWYDDSLDVIIGYNNAIRFYDAEMSAYRISTGELLWKQKLPHRYHWPWYDRLRDSEHKNMLYLMTDSLVRLDVVTGKTIKMPFTAGVEEPLKSKFSLVRTRLIFRRDCKEAYMCEFPYTADGVLSGTHSRMTLSGDTLFVADAKNLYCLDKQLNKRWATPLPADAGAKSDIRLLGDRIFLTNYGVAFQKGLLGRCGKPFVAEYDRHTGKELSVTFPDIKNKLSDGGTVAGRTYWQDDKGLMYNNQGEAEVHRIEWKAPVKKAEEAEEQDECYYWTVDTVYQYTEGRMNAIVTDAHQVLVEANAQDVYLLKDDGTKQIFKADSIFFKDSKDMYSNNGEKRTTFLITDDSPRQNVQMIFTFKGNLNKDDKGFLIATLPSGVGIIDPKTLKR
jgi:outer membrane protein assembly factor BamB